MNLAQELDSMVISERVLNKVNKKLKTLKTKEQNLDIASCEFGKNLFYKLCRKYKKHYLSGKEAAGEEFYYVDDAPSYKYFSHFFKNETPKLKKDVVISAFINEASLNGFSKSVFDDKHLRAILSSDRFIITVKDRGYKKGQFTGLILSHDFGIEFNEIKR